MTESFKTQPNNEQPNSKQIAGPVAKRIGAALPRIAVIVVAVVAACALPFWLWSGESSVTASESVSRPAFQQIAPSGNIVEVVPTATPVDWSQYRWSTEDEALAHCKVGETVLAWRGEFTCSIDMDAVRDRQLIGGAQER